MTPVQDQIDAWKTFPRDYQASDEERADLLEAAEAPHNPSWVFGALHNLLVKHGGMKPPEATKAVKDARLISGLGKVPSGVEEFVSLWLSQKSCSMSYSRVFANSADPSPHPAPVTFAGLQDEAILWCYNAKIYDEKILRIAFRSWCDAESIRLLKTQAGHLGFDATIGSDELWKFASIVTEQSDDDPQVNERLVRATYLIMATFIYRVKNHMRWNWKHHCHVMPVLSGIQGAGKTKAIDRFIEPMKHFFTRASFNVFSDNSREFSMARTPIVFFDELASAKKADVDHLKAVMTAAGDSLMRENYQNAEPTTIMATFIACTNGQLANIIQDPTGNRRYFQINTPASFHEQLDDLDYLAMWRCVDEDADVAPFMASEADKALIADIQSGQRYESPIERWLYNADDEDLPTGRMGATELFKRYFGPWMERAYPGQHRQFTEQSFAKTLAQIAREGRHADRLDMEIRHKAAVYTIIQPNQGGGYRPKVASAGGRLTLVRGAEKGRS